MDTAQTNSSLTALTIAGHDPSSGAGITADLLVFAAHGIFATSAITALTVQSTLGVQAVHPVDADMLTRTLACLEEDLPPAGIKIGMLAGAAHVEAVTGYLRKVRKLRQVRVVLDPVLRSSSGTVLLSHDGLQVLQRHLLPLVDIVTPNLMEAELLSGLPCSNKAEMETCAAALRERFPGLAVVLTGGHLDPPDDLFAGDDGPVWLEGKRVNTRSTHGTGCAFSSALLANSLLGNSWVDAARNAKTYVRSAMLASTPRGKGNGPMNLFQAP